MKLNEDKYQELISIIKEKRSNNGCLICGNNQLNVSDRVFKLKELEDNYPDEDFKGKVVPIVILSCPNCGDIRLVNPISLGIMK